MKKFSRSLRMVGVITLFFFSWSYLPLYQLAYAATQEKQGTKAQPQKSEKQQPADRLEKILADLHESTSQAAEKAAKGANASSEVESIKARRADLDAIDTDLKKEFSTTEQKLKSANLSKDILSRHYKFVKNYENNLAELKANIETIDKAKTPSEVTTALAKTQKHLDIVKPPKKRKPFDPNKLPNRIVKAKERQPKLKKEEWENELKKKALKDYRKSEAAQRQQPKPIIVAANGPLTGLLAGADSLPVSNPSESYIQLAATTTDGLLQTAQTGSYGKYPFPAEIYPLPWQTDMADEDNQETPETHVTDAIRAKAAELKNFPVLMFNWIYNNIQLVPSYGSIQGADMCLQTKQCNETDIASLTIAMFRAAGWPARYEFVTAELDINRFMENMGGFTDPQAAITFAATGGIPVRPVISGGKITAVQFERVYATALLPEGFYIGAGSLMRKGWSTPIWMPIDVSLKHYISTPGIDINAAVPFDAQSFANQIQSTATINEAEGYVTNVNSTLIQQTMQDYQARVQDYISQNAPTATVGDILGKREIKPINFPMLPPTGWTKPVSVRIRSHILPDSMLSSISFNIPDPSGATNGLSYTTSLPQIAGKKITLSFSPATATDQAVIESYLPKQHADGSPVQLSELPTSFPAYLINLRPELRIDGQVVATGTPNTMGQELPFTISLSEPGIGPSQINNIVLAGEYYGIGIDTGGFGNLATLNANLETTKAKIETQNYNGLTKDDLVGDLLYTTIASYFSELDVNDEITAKAMDVIRYRAPSIGMFSLKLDVKDIFGIPTAAGSRGMMMDVDRIMQAVFSKDGNMDKVKEYMQASGTTSSALEHSVPEKFYSTVDNPVNAISAVKALQIANDQGISVYTINQSNINNVLPQLQVSAEVIADIINAVNAGKEVTVSRTNINVNGWIGCGYIISDPLTGAGAYMISGGTNGAIVLLVLCLAILAIAVAIGPLAFVLVSLLMPIFASFLFWLAYGASDAVRNCITAIIISVGSLWAFVRSVVSPSTFLNRRLLSTLVSTSITRIGRACFDRQIAY
jgi:hypothetical protein